MRKAVLFAALALFAMPAVCGAVVQIGWYRSHFSPPWAVAMNDSGCGSGFHPVVIVTGYTQDPAHPLGGGHLIFRTKRKVTIAPSLFADAYHRWRPGTVTDYGNGFYRYDFPFFNAYPAPDTTIIIELNTIIAGPLAQPGDRDTMTLIGAELRDTSGVLRATAYPDSGPDPLSGVTPTPRHDKLPFQVFANNEVHVGLVSSATEVPADGDFSVSLDVLAPNWGVSVVEAVFEWDTTMVQNQSVGVLVFDDYVGCLFRNTGACTTTECGDVFAVGEYDYGDTTFSILAATKCLAGVQNVEIPGRVWTQPFKMRHNVAPGTSTIVKIWTELPELNGAPYIFAGSQQHFFDHSHVICNPCAVTITVPYPPPPDGGGCDGPYCIDPARALRDGKAVEWYDVAGRKLHAKPTQRGVYFIRVKGSQVSRVVTVR